MRRAAVLLWVILRLGSALRVARPPHAAAAAKLDSRGPRATLDRRAFAAALTTVVPAAANAALARDAPPPPGILENRDRGLNEKALIANDFYFVTGRKPPRVLDIQNLPRDDPKWNAWGECASGSDGSNACTYIPLKQRYDAYSKHGLTVRAASEDLVDLGQALRKKDLNTASFLLDSGEKGKAPSSLRQASRKALLLADGLLISANSGSLGREVLVARYYINEFHYATERIAEILSVDDVDWPAAADLWRLGADSYNSFFVCVNKAIVPKVGEKFAAVRV